jgi:hypothetical protein
MKRFIRLSAYSVLSVLVVAPSASAAVRSWVTYRIADPVNGNRNDEVIRDAPIGPVNASIVDPVAGKARASGSAEHGRLGIMMEIDPDFGGTAVAYSSTHFVDGLTIDGDNSGATATAIFRLHVDGVIRQPFIVSEAIGFTDASIDFGIETDLDDDFKSRYYFAEGTGSPVINAFDEVVEISVPFTVGSRVSVFASLYGGAEGVLNVPPDVETFATLFNNTAKLLPIALRNVVNPTITAESGTNYSFVPEPSCMGMLALTVLMGHGTVRRRSMK